VGEISLEVQRLCARPRDLASIVEQALDHAVPVGQFADAQNPSGLGRTDLRVGMNGTSNRRWKQIIQDAKALGLDVPFHLQQRADEVIE
jgi:hypothetical protein